MAKEKKQSVAKPQAAVGEKEYLTAREAAEFIGATINYFYKLTCAHKLPMYNPTGRRLLFRRSELVAWIQKSRVSSAAELAANAEMQLIKKGGCR